MKKHVKVFLFIFIALISSGGLTASAATLTCTYSQNLGQCNLITPLPSNCQPPPTAEPALAGKMICSGPPNGYTCNTDQNPILCDPTPPATNQTQTQQPSTNTSGNLKYVPLEPLPGIDQSGQANFVRMLSTFFTLLLTLGAFLAVTTFVIGGIAIMFSEVPGARAIGKERVTASLIGLAILGSAWLGLRTINPQLIGFNENFLSPLTSSNPSDSNFIIHESSATGWQNWQISPQSGSGNITTVRINDNSPTKTEEQNAFTKKCEAARGVVNPKLTVKGSYTLYECVNK